MEIIVVMITFSLILAGLFLYAFFWAADKNQFDDLYTPKWRILQEDESINNKTNDKNFGDSNG